MHISNLIIGAGPAGLAVAGRLRQQGIPFEIIEQTDKIASSWHGHYDRLHLHSVKRYSHLPHRPFPKTYPTYVSRQQLVNYLEDYARHFDIQPHFGQSVESITKRADGTWQVSAKDQFVAKHVIVATGINRVPYVPTWQGQADFEGTIIHSKSYKNPKPFLGQPTLVIGMGNTGAEVALDLSNHGIMTYLSVRSPINIVPRDLHGRSVQVTSKKLAKLPWGIGDWLGDLIRKRYIGDIRPYGLTPATMHPAKQLLETGKTPLIDIGTLDAIKAGAIKIVPNIKCFTPKGVILEGGQELAVEQVILATGYRAKVEDFLEKGALALNKFGVPKQAVGTAFHKGIFFVGYDNYTLGGILGTIYTDSETVVQTIKKEVH